MTARGELRNTHARIGIGRFGDKARSRSAVVCLVCQEPCNIASCVERNRLEANSSGETLVEEPAARLWEGANANTAAAFTGGLATCSAMRS
jgi:hypothetical protein